MKGIVLTPTPTTPTPTTKEVCGQSSGDGGGARLADSGGLTAALPLRDLLPDVGALLGGGGPPVELPGGAGLFLHGRHPAPPSPYLFQPLGQRTVQGADRQLILITHPLVELRGLTNQTPVKGTLPWPTPYSFFLIG